MSECAWCGTECDESVGSVREYKLTYIDNGVEANGAPNIEWLYFCSKIHRHYYFVGL